MTNEYSEEIRRSLPTINEKRYDPTKISGIDGVISVLDFGTKFLMEENGENNDVFRHFSSEERLIVSYEMQMDNDGMMWAVPKIKGGTGMLCSTDSKKQAQIEELDKRLLNHLGKYPIKIELPEPVVKMPIPEWVIGKGTMSSRFYFSSEAKKIKQEFIKRLELEK